MSIGSDVINNNIRRNQVMRNDHRVGERMRRRDERIDDHPWTRRRKRARRFCDTDSDSSWSEDESRYYFSSVASSSIRRRSGETSLDMRSFGLHEDVLPVMRA